MRLSDFWFWRGIAKCSSTFELGGDSHVNHDECDAGADCREEYDKQVLFTDGSHIDDSSRAVVVPQGLVNLS